MSLPPDAARLLSAALRSTEPSSCKTEWTAWFERNAADADGRAANGPRNAQTYSAKVRAGIRLAIGSLPANGVRLPAQAVLNRIARAGPEAFGLRRIPDEGTTLSVIREMEQERSPSAPRSST